MRLTLFILLSLSTTGWARMTRNPPIGIRPSGMGNAFSALADDSNAVFYNPAALARVKGSHFTLIDFDLGVESLDSLNRIGNAVFKGDTNNLIRTERPMYIRMGLKPTFFLTQYFAISIYDRVQAFFDLDALKAAQSFDPLNPDLTILQRAVDFFFFNDLGIMTAFAIPASQYFSLGVSFRLLLRTAVDSYITVQQMLESAGMDASGLMNNLTSSVLKSSGVGWGLGATIGALIKVPLPVKSPELFLSTAIEDVGNTTFRSYGNYPRPAPVKAVYVAGAALKYSLSNLNQLNVLLDLKSDFVPVHFIRTVCFGTELKLGGLALRTGLYDGYFTYGTSLRLAPHTDLHFSSYALELGADLWEKSQRFFLLQLAIGFNPL